MRRLKIRLTLSILAAAVSIIAYQGPRSGKDGPSRKTYTAGELRAELEAINGHIARHVVLEQTDSLVMSAPM